MSKYILNSFQTPNAIIDDLMPVLTDSEFRVLMFLVREILGWSSSVESKRARISQSVMESGYTYTDKDSNKQVKPGCGVSIGTIRNALKALQKYRIIKKVGKPTNDGQMWELCLVTDSDPDIAGLKLRHETKSRKAKKQTEKARKTNPKNQGGSVQQIPHRGVSSTDSQGVSSTDSQGVSSTDTNETHRNTEETNGKGQAPQPDQPKILESSFQRIRRLVDNLGLLTTKTTIELFKSDFDDYTLEQWSTGIEIFKQRRKEKNEYLPYKYLASIVKGVEAEAKQEKVIAEQDAALVAANKRAMDVMASMKAEMDSWDDDADSWEQSA